MKPGEAIVVKNAGSHFMLSRLPEWNPFPAIMRGKIRLEDTESTNPIAVGDRVSYVPEDDIAVITEVLERKNYMIRKSTNLSRQNHVIAANLDRAVIVVSLYLPEIKLPFLDRVLVTCEVYGVKPVIVLNKIDLYPEAAEEIEYFVDVYTKIGYKVLKTSCKTGEGIDELRSICSDGVSLFSGESGVGKSSIIKALDPSLSPRIAQISLAHLQGRHTTSLYEMYPLGASAKAEKGDAGKSCPEIGIKGDAGESCPEIGIKGDAGDCCSEGGHKESVLQHNGFIIDTPGLRGFGLVDLEKEEIALYFPEMLRVGRKCFFTPCTHTHEPDCAVKEAIEKGEISPERYNSYLGMLEEDGKFR
ncbi:MAG TPA: ribosome small subunit-dependent GTPase A [Candidatus Cryptobacteroides sp.]|nr:ribosome small subunit-dependent GTPase A [Candidatus Cryptobacteroides sp.]